MMATYCQMHRKLNYSME